MNSAVVLDACALIAFTCHENGWQRISRYFKNARCLAHAVTISEYLHVMARDTDEATAINGVADLVKMGLRIRRDTDNDFLQAAAFSKTAMRRAGHKLSLADGFAVALAQLEEVAVVTSDHDEFKPVANVGLCQVAFFRGQGRQ